MYVVIHTETLKVNYSKMCRKRKENVERVSGNGQRIKGTSL